MVGNELIEAQKPAPLTVGIAIDGKKNSKYLLNWALDKFDSEKNVAFKLLHVRPVVTSVPTPMGNSIPIAHVREDIAAAYRKEIEWRTSQMLLPFNNFCIRRQVKAEVVAIESDDVVYAIKEQVTKTNIKKLVIGAAPRGLLTRKIRKNTLSSRISASVPNFCTVLAVSKGKLLSIRPSNEKTNTSSRDNNNSSASHSSTGDSSSNTYSTQSDFASFESFSRFSSTSLPIHLQRFQALSTMNMRSLRVRTNSVDINHTNLSCLRCQSLPIEKRNYAGSHLTQSSSCKSTQAYKSDHCSSNHSENITFELEKLRIELRHMRGMYAVAQSEAIDASRKLNDLKNRHNEESSMLKEIEQRADLVKKLANEETKKREAATEEAEYTWQRVEREAAQREEAERRATRHAKEKEKLESAIQGSAELYQKYTWQEIESATSLFSEKSKIGMGANGTVYKCNLHHTAIAVKILTENSDFKQLQKEIEILSKVRHPNLLSLLGACPDKGCLIYEYMENGNLEERLLRSNNTPPIPWFERFRIAWEIASALVFLHNAKPKPIVHRDLKPANILLDRNFVSKIGDVGLSAILQSDGSYATTCPVGTICYIDPEYQRTGSISVKSDVYAFGVVILQLLTAKSAMGLQYIVESAIEGGNLLEILDPGAGYWPHGETRELAILGLSCAELRRGNRPDLEEKVLPVLERLKEVADEARDGALRSGHVAPGHFLCPILKDVMMEPSVAADGYTYEREVIEKWMEEHEESPMTNLPLGNKNLVPNYALLSAIMEWKSKN